MAPKKSKGLELPAHEVKKIDALMNMKGGEKQEWMWDKNSEYRVRFMNGMAEYEKGKVSFGKVVDLLGLGIEVVIRHIEATEIEVKSWGEDKKEQAEAFYAFKKEFVKFMREYKKYEIGTKSADSRAFLASVVSPLNNSFAMKAAGMKLEAPVKAVDKVNVSLRRAYMSRVKSFSKKYSDMFDGNSLTAKLNKFSFQSVKSVAWRNYFATNVLNYRTLVEKKKKEFETKSNAILSKKGVDWIQELVDFDTKFQKDFDKLEKRVKDMINEWQEKANSLGQHDYFENFKAIYKMSDNAEAKRYLENGVFGYLKRVFAGLDAKYKDVKKDDGKNKFDKYKEFKDIYESMVSKYVGEGGKLDDSGYSFFYPMGVLLQTAGQVIVGKIKKKDMFEYVPDKSRIEEHIPSFAALSLEEIVGSGAFQINGVLSGVVVEAENEAKNLQYNMRYAGFDVDVPDAFNLGKYIDVFSGKIALIEDLYGKARFNMSYLRAELDGGVSKFFNGLPEKFEGKNAAKHTAELAQLKTMYGAYKAKWLDSASGPLGSSKKFSSPLAPTYLAMEAMDEAAPMFERINDFKNALDADEIYYHSFYYDTGRHNADFFKMVFPKWSYKNVGAAGLNEVAAQAPGQ